MAQTRRTFLGAVGGGCLAGGISLRLPHPGAGGGADLPELVALVQRTPRAELLARAVQLHAGGVHWRELLAAAFLAGIHDVQPRPVGFKFHCVLMTASAFAIADALPERERLAVALFNLDDFKNSQAQDVEAGDWTLPPAPDIGADVDAAKAAAALVAAMTERDPAAADRAVTTLARVATLDQAFEPLWWFGARDFTNVGHHPIFVAQAYRTLQQIGWQHAEPVLRSLVWGLLAAKAGADDAAFVANQERAAALRLADDGKPSARATGDVLRDLHTKDADGAAAMVAALLHDGLALDAVLDGLRLMAIEQLWRQPGVLAVHALTSLNALRFAAGTAQAEHTRAMALLQAASWQVQYRDFLGRGANYDREAPGLDAIAVADGASTPASVFATARAARRDTAPQALLCARAGTAGLLAAMRHWLVRKVGEHHDYKFAEALAEEIAAAAPDTAARMFAGSVGYLRRPSDPDHAAWKLVADQH